MKFFKKNNEKLLIESFIQQFSKELAKKEKTNKRFSFVLTGGPSPINLYKKLSKLNINWRNIDFFWGDERYVSQKSNFSNFKMVKKYLLNKININKKQIFSMNIDKKNALLTSLDYSNKIKKYFNNKNIIFDLTLLGMGNDGHIASIFSDNLNIKLNEITYYVKRKDFDRITMSLKTINKSKNIYLWLNDKKKTKIFNLLKKSKKKIPVLYLNKNKTSIFKIQ